MEKVYETIIDNFSGGVTSQKRDTRKNTARMVTNFDIFSDVKLTPYHNSEDGDSLSTTEKRQAFTVGLRSGTTYKLFGLGVVDGNTTAQIKMKSLSTSGTQDLGDNLWDSPSNNTSASGATSFGLFTYYQKTGKIYGSKGLGETSAIWGFDTTSAVAFSEDIINTETSGSQSSPTNMVNIAQGLVHSKDDVLYIPHDNIIMSNNNGTWNLTALTLPSYLKITSICEYGNYLAIASAPLSNVGNSVVYLWDRDSSLATISETINWGTGTLKVLEEISGYLVGITDDDPNSLNPERSSVVFKYLSGNRVIEIDRLLVSSSIALNQSKQKLNDRLYFLGDFKNIDGEQREGVWSIGLNNGNFVINHERTSDNTTVLGNGTLNNFYIAGGYTFISYKEYPSNDFKLSKTNESSSAYSTGIYEKIFNTVNSSTTKKLLGVTVMTEPLPTNGQVVLKYAIDNNIGTNTWTTIFTEDTDNSISHSAINIESSGAVLPEYKEIAFRIESTFGAEITGLKFKEEIIDKDIY